MSYRELVGAPQYLISGSRPDTPPHTHFERWDSIWRSTRRDTTQIPSECSRTSRRQQFSHCAWQWHRPWTAECRWKRSLTLTMPTARMPAEAHHRRLRDVLGHQRRFLMLKEAIAQRTKRH
ncbi:hypothetical protein PybrP1_008833 [[Pythium] brassicae (nom. inval.)]|nr:hypothetical protein PybrP1_008833 [[Pythium] brassicae (nom. inval.)]